jgi:hypothetical protein
VAEVSVVDYASVFSVLYGIVPGIVAISIFFAMFLPDGHSLIVVLGCLLQLAALTEHGHSLIREQHFDAKNIDKTLSAVTDRCVWDFILLRFSLAHFVINDQRSTNLYYLTRKNL